MAAEPLQCVPYGIASLDHSHCSLPTVLWILSDQSPYLWKETCLGSMRGGEKGERREAHLPPPLSLVTHHCLHLAPQTTGYGRRGRGGEGEEEGEEEGEREEEMERRRGREREEERERRREKAVVWTHTKVLPVSLPEEVLGPHNAVNGFTGCVAYGTAGERLGSWLWLALITLTVTLQRRALDRGSACEGNMLVVTLRMTVTCPR